MHKIKLKLKQANLENIINNLKELNFNFGGVFEDDGNVKILFYSQYQIERFLNITNLEKYRIETSVEKFGECHKVAFEFCFDKFNLKIIEEKLSNYLNEIKT